MRKRLHVFFIFFCSVLVCMASQTLAATFTVTTPAEFQTALDTAEANGADDTINVAAGTFSISTTLEYVPGDSENYSLEIIGAGSDLTILDGGNTAKILFIYEPETDKTNANVSISGITFQNGNYDDYAGGLHVECYSGVITIENNFFINNVGDEEGGGLYAYSYDEQVNVINNVFQGNSVVDSGDGGGAFIGSRSGTINAINNTFIENTSDDYGGGLCVSSFLDDHIAEINVYNNIIWNNVSTNEPSSSDLYAYDAENRTVNVYNNDYSSFVRAGYGTLNQGDNIDQDPLLSADFHLQAGSPAINSGTNSVPIFLPSEDFEGDPRIVDGTVDMGADERLWGDNPIPTMNEWGLIILSLLLGGFGLWYVRRGAVV